MQASLFSFTSALALILRQMFLRILTPFVVGLPEDQVRSRIQALPVLDQAMLVGATLTGLAVSTLLFSEAGPGGPLAMWATLWLLTR